MSNNELSLMDGMILDMLAEGKSPRAIAEVVKITPAEAAKRAYELLDKEIITDADSRRKLQVYRLEKIIEALWARTMEHAGQFDVKNLLDTLDKLNILLALNKEQDAQMVERMANHQLAAYMGALMGLIAAFKNLAPQLMTPEEWAQFAVDQLEIAEKQMMIEE